MGVDALMRSRRPVLVKLREAAAMSIGDEKDVGFRLGPRINAVGRLEHANKVISAFVDENPDELIEYMGICNEKRKLIQKDIVAEAQIAAKKYLDDPILFLGGDWHPGVVGIAASKIAEDHWRPVWLFQIKDGLCKGSARSIAGFDVTDAMMQSEELFGKFGGHKAAGGFTFPLENLEKIRAALCAYAGKIKKENPLMWESSLEYDCKIPLELADLNLVAQLDDLKPYGHKFSEPVFEIKTNVHQVTFYKDKQTGEDRHTAVSVKMPSGAINKIMFFNQVHRELVDAGEVHFVVSLSRNVFRGNVSLSMMGYDFRLTTH
jgi:single-stranded-DNA-specific exonuclease